MFRIKREDFGFSVRMIQVAILVTMMAYSSNEVVNRVCNEILPYMWIGCVFAQSFDGRKIEISQTVCSLLIVTVLYVAKTYIFNWSGVYNAKGLGPGRTLWLCVIYYYLGSNFYKNLPSSYRKIMSAYFVGTVYLGIQSVVEVSSPDFLYWENNAAHLSVIVAAGILLMIFVFTPKRKLWKYLALAFALVALVTMITMHTRTPAIAALVTWIYFFLSSPMAKKKKIAVIVAVALVLTAVELNAGRITQFIREFFPYQMEDASIQTVEDLDVFLSGRVSIYIQSWKDFIRHPIIGIGNQAYVDLFALYVLRTGGLLSAVLLFPVAYGIPFSVAFRAKRLENCTTVPEHNRVLLSARILAMYFTIVSLMEASPPLGTGTMVFLPWMMYGMADAVCRYETEAKRRPHEK